MSRLSFTALCAVVLVVPIARAATGGAPVTLAQSGYLLDPSDQPVEGTQPIVFRILDAATGGEVQWEASCSAQVHAGYFDVRLGAGACAGTGGAGDAVLDSSDLPPDATRWLELEVGGALLEPRLTLASVPTAALASRALEADRLEGHVAADFAAATHPHDAADVTTGKLDNARLHTGPGGALDADTVDGQHAADFAAATHPHDAADVTTGKLDNARLHMGPGGALDADTVDGLHAADFAGKSHTHTLEEVTGLGALAGASAVAGGTGGTITDGTITNADLAPGAFPAITGVGTLGSLTVAGNVSLGGNQLVGFRVQNASADPATCTASTAGMLYFNTATNTFFGCNGTAFSALGAACGSSASVAGLSCADLRSTCGPLPSGPYWVDPNGGTRADAFQVYCDMTTLDAAGGTGWMLAASFATDYTWSESHVTSSEYFGLVALNKWSSNFGNVAVKDLRVLVAPTATSLSSAAVGDWYYHRDTSIEWKRWWAAAAGTGQVYNVGLPRWSLAQFNGAYNLKYATWNTGLVVNGLSDQTGTWPDFWTALTTPGSTIDIYGQAGDGSFGWLGSGANTGQDVSNQQSLVGHDDTTSIACFGASASTTGCTQGVGTGQSSSLWIWVK